MAARDVIIQLLPILDNFSLALKNKDAEKEHLVNGVELIYAQLNTLLENNGIKSITTDNQKFNPHFHEALMKVESEKEENSIVEELQKGFTLNGKVIRHAKVKVSMGKEKDSQHAQDDSTPMINENKFEKENKKSLKTGAASSVLVGDEKDNGGN